MSALLTHRQTLLTLAAWCGAVALWIIFSPGIVSLIDALARETFHAF